MGRPLARFFAALVVTAAVVAAIAVDHHSEPLASFPAPGDLPSRRDAVAIAIAPARAHAKQVVHVEVSGTHNWAGVYAIDERVKSDWVKRFEGGGFGCGLSRAERAQPARLWALECGLPYDEDTHVQLPTMREGAYRLRMTFYADLAGREQFELAAPFAVT